MAILQIFYSTHFFETRNRTTFKVLFFTMSTSYVTDLKEILEKVE